MMTLTKTPARLPLSGVFTFLLILFAALSPAYSANQVVAWGAGTVVKIKDGNDFGQSIIPANLTNAVFVTAGWQFSLALKANHTIQGWGSDSFGETDFPTTNVLGSNYVYEAIACGEAHSLALLSNGTVMAEGYDAYEQADVPFGLSNVVAVACGFYHGLALKSDGTVAAWGAGSNTTVYFGQSAVPAGLSNVVAIAGGGYHSLALKSDGTLVAWGQNDAGEASIPPGLSNVVAIAAGANFNLALSAHGTLTAWGNNTYGQTNLPAGLSNVVAIAAGSWHGLALKSNGTVAAWGAGVGSNTNVDYKQNIVPSNLTNVIQIGAGWVNSLALVGGHPPVTKVPLTVTGFATNGFTVALPTRNGRVYQLEYEDSLTGQSWNPFPLKAGLGTTTQFRDPGPPVAQRFYQVNQW